MRKSIIYVFLMLFAFLSNPLYSQQTLKFGNVQMKDTLGSLKLNTGGFYSDFVYTLGNIIVYNDAGKEFYLSGASSGLLMFMENNIAEFNSDGINLYVPFYPSQYNSSGINGLTVSNGALVMNTSTNELYTFLGSEWKALLTDEFLQMDSDGINAGAPFYPPQYTSSEINGLTVSEGAMVINSETSELLIYLNGGWNIVSINPK